MCPFESLCFGKKESYAGVCPTGCPIHRQVSSEIFILIFPPENIRKWGEWTRDHPKKVKPGVTSSDEGQATFSKPCWPGGGQPLWPHHVCAIGHYMPAGPAAATGAWTEDGHQQRCVNVVCVCVCEIDGAFSTAQGIGNHM